MAKKQKQKNNQLWHLCWIIWVNYSQEHVEYWPAPAKPLDEEGHHHRSNEGGDHDDTNYGSRTKWIWWEQSKANSFRRGNIVRNTCWLSLQSQQEENSSSLRALFLLSERTAFTDPQVMYEYHTVNAELCRCKRPLQYLQWLVSMYVYKRESSLTLNGIKP